MSYGYVDDALAILFLMKSKNDFSLERKEEIISGINQVRVIYSHFKNTKMLLFSIQKVIEKG